MGTATTASGRWVACAGLAAGVSSLAIRSTSRGGWGPAWLAVPALLVEWLGVLAGRTARDTSRPRRATRTGSRSPPPNAHRRWSCCSTRVTSRSY